VPRLAASVAQQLFVTRPAHEPPVQACWVEKLKVLGSRQLQPGLSARQPLLVVQERLMKLFARLIARPRFAILGTAP
jgi:hypothetical protein